MLDFLEFAICFGASIIGIRIFMEMANTGGEKFRNVIMNVIKKYKNKKR